LKLDLHGVRHKDVVRTVESHYYEFGVPFEVVIGNSLKMREIVLQVVKEHGLGYFNAGTGSLVIIEKPL